MAGGMRHVLGPVVAPVAPSLQARPKDREAAEDETGAGQAAGDKSEDGQIRWPQGSTGQKARCRGRKVTSAAV